MNRIVSPGAAIGVLGSGQLGRMFAIAARRLGYRVHVLSPDDDTPTGQVADVEIKASYDDLDRVAEFARAVEVVTFEFENVPAATAETAERFAPVRPAGGVLHISQNRLREKRFLSQNGLPVTPFLAAHSSDEARQAVESLRGAAVLKTASWGYDGKGQCLVRNAEEAVAAYRKLGEGEVIVEALVDFQCELSVVGARSLDGQSATYEPIVNDHAHHILDVSFSPSGLGSKVESRAKEIARQVLEKLDVVGVLCVEMFLTSQGELLINELAPRPHNSGHLTIDAHETCQFEQQVRGVCGLPLGSTDMLRPAAMANLLGELWRHGEPAWANVLSRPHASLHLYGKREARPGRKMGHITVLAESAAQAAAEARQARLSLLARPE